MPFDRNRREFLAGSFAGAGAVALAAFLPGCSFPFFRTANRAGAGESLFFVSDPFLGGDGISKLCIFDPAKRSLSTIPVPMELAHGCFTHPRRPELVFSVEQSGPRACMVNLATREVRAFSLDAGAHDFYGHGLFLPGGEFFVTTEVDRNTKAGRIAVRRADTLRIEETIPSHGLNPHDLRLIKGDTVLVAANHGHGYNDARNQESSVTFLELASRKLLHQTPIEEPGCFASHLEAVDDDEVLVACRRISRRAGEEAERIRREMQDPKTRAKASHFAWKTIQYIEAPLYWIKSGTVMAKAQASELSMSMKNSLSLAYAPGPRVLGITHFEGGLISFWDARTRKLLRAHELPGKDPHGLVYLARENAFVAGLTQGLLFIDANTLELAKDVVPAPFGVHMGRTSYTG